MTVIFFVKLLLFCATWHTTFIKGQRTDQNQGCTFYDDNYVYNIALTRGAGGKASCPTITTLNDQFKHHTDRLFETSHEVMQLQGSVLRLTEKVEDLTKTVADLQSQLAQKKEETRHCPSSYTIHSETFNSCYMFVEREHMWYEAQLFCMSTGGNLVGIETKEEQDFLVAQISANTSLTGNHIWTGGNDIAMENRWMWVGTDTPANYTQWWSYSHPEKGLIDQPDNHENAEHCLQLVHLHNYNWNDINCIRTYYSICEYKLT